MDNEYSLAFKFTTNRSYLIQYIYQKNFMNVTMKKKINEIFITFEVRKIFLNNGIKTINLPTLESNISFEGDYLI